MNEKQLLVLLQSDQSPATFRIAADWIVRRTPSSKAAQRVLRELLRIPGSECVLPLIGQWVRTAIWDELGQVVVETDSVSLFEWIMEVAESNPQHPQAGELWSNIVSNCRDCNVASRACRWFVDSCTAEQHTFMLTEFLMDDLASQSVIDKARKLFGKDTVDFGLLETLLKFDDYEPAIEMVTEKIKNADDPYYNAEIKALLQRNPQRFQPLIEGHVRKLWNHKHAYLLLSSCAESYPQGFVPIITEWLNSSVHPSTFVVRHLAVFANSKELASLIWDWCQKQPVSEETVFTIQILLSCRDSTILPKEAVELGLEWSQKNRGKSGSTHLAASMIRIAANDGRLLTGIVPLDYLADESIGDMMAAIAKHSSDLELLAIARKWREKFPSNRYSVAIVHSLCSRFPDQEIIELAKSSIPNFSGPVDLHLLVALVKAGDEQSITYAKERLTAEQIHRRWSSEHEHKGMLFLALIEGGNADSIILELARDWLRLKPKPGEQELHDLLTHAVGCIGR